MTIEEAIQLAENGDIGAMMALGQHYFQQNTGEGISKAAEWYEAAAKQNVVLAIHLTVICKKILAYAGLQIAEHDEFGAQFAMNDWKEVYDWAAKELECINAEVEGTEKLNIDDALNNFTETSYFYALTCYWADRFCDVTALLSDFDDTRSKILFGAALIQLAETNTQMANAMSILTPIIKDTSYAAADKGAWEEDVYTLTALQLSMLYKNNGSQSDMESAVSLLNFVLRAVKNENNIAMLRSELNHYQKKLFGGYKYA